VLAGAVSDHPATWGFDCAVAMPPVRRPAVVNWCAGSCGEPSSA